MSSFRALLCIFSMLILLGMSTTVAAAALSKTQTNIMTAEEIANIRKTRVWAGVDIPSLIVAADRWMKYTPQQLRDIVPPAWVPRAYDVNYLQDPLHSAQILQMGRYPWIISPDLPYKVKCPVGGEIYPTNDFDPAHPTSPNSVSSEPYVDNGWGWRKPGEEEKYWFVGYYVHWLYYDYLRPAAVTLGKAYIATGDPKYSRQAAILLDKIAEEYPHMDYATQSREGTELFGSSYGGRIVNRVWETVMAADLAEAYDYAYNGLAGDTALEQAVGKSIAQIRWNIEQNLLESAAQSIVSMDGRFRGNFGMNQKTLATIATVLSNDHTATYFDFVLNNTGGVVRAEEGIISGLNNLIFRDGAPSESSPGYIAHWVEEIDNVARILLKQGVNLYQQEPKLMKLFNCPLNLVMAGKFTPNIGDSGGVASSGVLGWNGGTYSEAYRQYNSKAYLLGQPLTTTSDNMSAYGLAMLRNNNSSKPAGISIYYGPGFAHSHYDRLNLEMFAKGYRILPDIGYPEYMDDNSKKDAFFTRNTVSHNLVVVDGKRQTTKDGGRIQAFAGLPDVQYADIRAEEAYPGIERYQRSVAMVNAPDGEVYALDVFRVAGGKQHDYSLHGPDGGFAVSDIQLSSKLSGTVAGENVPFSYAYDNLAMEKTGYNGPYGSYTGSGFSYLNNVQRAQTTSVWSADWAVNGSNVHIRSTFIPQSGTEVYVADGEMPRNVAGNPDSLKYIIARKKAGNLQSLGSTFVTILQPYSGKPFIQAVTPLGGQLPTGATDVVALRIDQTGGSDYVFQSVDAGIKKQWGEEAAFQGLLGVIARGEGGLLRHASLVGGVLVQQDDVRLQTAGDYAGQIKAVDYEAGYIIITLNDNAPDMPVGNILAGQRIVISNTAHATEYIIKQVTAKGDRQFQLEVMDPDFLTGRAKVNTTKPGTSTSSFSTKTVMILDAYYKGQRLTNVVTGETRRIIDFSGYGSNIVCAGNNMGLNPGDYFNIYDFGVGDQFKIFSTVSVQNNGGGDYTVTSNVSGKLTLWGGQEFAFTAGKQGITVSQLTVSMADLPVNDNGEVFGRISPQVSVTVPAHMGLSQLDVLLDEQCIFTGASVPQSGQLAFDTANLLDGDHTITVVATDTWGKSTTRTWPIKVANWWQIATELPSPINSIFGYIDFTGTYARSEGWQFVSGASEDYNDDIDRMVKPGATDEYLTWETPALRRYLIKMYSKTETLPVGVEVAGSVDGEHWQALFTTTNVMGQLASGWWKLAVTGEVDSATDINFLRLTVNGTVPGGDLEIGAVDLTGLNR